MKLIDTILVKARHCERRIELLQGDLSRIPPEHTVDTLVVSAFPNDYIATSSSLIGALQRRGLSVGALANNQLVDLRSTCSCWLSPPIGEISARFNFRSIICFEPLKRGQPPELVGDIFRAITPFTGGNPPLQSVAMPLLAAGDQGYPISSILPPLIDAAYHWLSIGLPLEVIKIVAYSDADSTEASREFSRIKANCEDVTVTGRSRKDYDVFVSYAHVDRPAAITIREDLDRSKLRVFFDERSIDRGSSWQQTIFDALDSCERVLALFSPAYIHSKVCQEEFNIAWARGRNETQPILFPVYWKSTELPTHMTLLNHADTREEDPERLTVACRQLIDIVRGLKKQIPNNASHLTGDPPRDTGR